MGYICVEKSSTNIGVNRHKRFADGDILDCSLSLSEGRSSFSAKSL